MTINKRVQQTSCTSSNISFNSQHSAVITNVIALTLLFVGYLLTTGTQLIESESLKDFFRLTSALTLVTYLIIKNSINIKFLYLLAIMGFFLVASQSPITINIIFLVLITTSLSRLDHKELTITLLIPTLITVSAHGLLLYTDLITTEIVEIGERTRNSLGFSNPNQVSSIYFSLVLITTFTHLTFRNKYSFLLLITAFTLSFFIFLTTDTRTSIFGIFIFATLTLTNEILKKRKIYVALLRTAGLFAPVAAASMTMYITNASGTELDIILSLRPYFFSEFIKETSILDLIVGWRNSDESGVDNFFLMLLSAVGIALTTTVIIFITIRIFKMKIEFIPIMLILMLISIFESLLLRPEIPSAVLFMCLLFSPLAQQKNH